jgi:hypothetical protein
MCRRRHERLRDVLHEDEVAHDEAVAPDLKRPPGERCLQERRHSLCAASPLQGAVGVREAQHDTVETASAEEREIALDRELVQAMGGDRLGRRRFRDRDRGRGSVHRAAGRDEHEAAHAELGGKRHQPRRGSNIIGDLTCRIGLGERRRGRPGEEVHHLGRDEFAQPCRVAELA